MVNKKNSIVFCLTVFLSLCVGVSLAHAQSTIRDTEIEETLRAYSNPIFEAASIPPTSVELVLVDSPIINAFVAGGMNIFIFTGLILETDEPTELIAIIAHETGHITGGHLVRFAERMEEAQIQSVIAYILGGLVAVGSGESKGGKAATAAAQNFLEKNLLRHSRIQESAADQAGFGFLKTAGISLQGNLKFLNKLHDQEGLSAGRQNEYVRTHPMTIDRITSVETQVALSKDLNLSAKSEWQERHDRMKAKIMAYTYPQQALWHYSGLSIADTYAKAVAYYKLGKIDDRFLPLINGLIEKEPENPYFYEVKGQALLENGRVDEALPALKKAVELKPTAPLILTLYGHALLETGTDKNVREAIAQLKKSLDMERPNILRYRLLSRAYGKIGDEPRAKLYFAEESVLKGEWDLATNLAKEVQDKFAEGTPENIRAQDIVNYAQNFKAKLKKK